MATIQITRPNEWINRARNYKIFLNGEKVGTIKNNSTLDLNVIPEGNQTLVAKIDWCCSPEIEITTKGDEIKYVKVSSSKSLKWVYYIAIPLMLLAAFLRHTVLSQYKFLLFAPFALFVIYMVTIGRKKYLSIEAF